MVKVEIKTALDPSQCEPLCGLQQSQQMISCSLLGTDRRESTYYFCAFTHSNSISFISHITQEPVLLSSLY